MTPYEHAQAHIGTWEWKDGHNPKILKWFGQAGHDWVKDDETPWCAAFVGGMLVDAGLQGTGRLDARSYLDWGQHVDLKDAQPGDIVVFSRGDPNGWQGHVAFYVETKGENILVLGGNQRDQVNIARYSKSRLLGIRTKPELRSSAPPPADHVKPAQRPQRGGLWAFLRRWL